MIDVYNWILTHWPSIALAVLPLLAVQYCWEFRDHMNLWAWLFYAVFVALFFADNSWRLAPFPELLTLETGRRWEIDVRLYHGINRGWCAIAALTIAFLAAMQGRLKGAAALLCATVIMDLVGGHMEYTYCRLNDPVRYTSHIYLFEGGRNPACARIAEFGLGQWWAWVGVWFAPILTVAPSVFAMGWVARKKRLGT